MVIQVPLKPLDNDCLPGSAQSEENGKYKWVKPYTMVIITHRRQKCRNQNWRYSQKNHFGLSTNLFGLFSYLFGVHPNFQGISGTFSGVSTISGLFQDFQGIQGSLVTLNSAKSSRTAVLKNICQRLLLKDFSFYVRESFPTWTISITIYIGIEEDVFLKTRQKI